MNNKGTGNTMTWIKRCKLFFIMAVLPVFLMSAYENVTVHPLYQQALRQFEAKQFDSAFILFDTIIVQFPDKKEGYYNRGLCFLNTAKYDSAIVDFDRTLQIDSAFKDAIFMKALALQNQGNYLAAFTEYKKLDTTYTGYNELQKHIRYYSLCVTVSKYWYYMIAILFMSIILIAVVTKTITYRRG